MKEILWIKQLLIAIGVQVERPVVIYEDNAACISMVNDFMATNRYIQIPCDRIKDRVQSSQITLEYVPSSEQLADMFTKSLTKENFQKLRDLIGIRKPN